MIPVLSEILSDKTGGLVFRCFDVWHLLYIAVTAAVIAAAFLALRKKSPGAKEKARRLFIDIAFGLYMLDFILMPFAYGEISVEKLPFHVCTAMCVCCFVSCHVPALKGISPHFALLGLISNLTYLVYPAGVMWSGVSPFSYRVIQTLVFHAVMTVYGMLTVVYGRESFRFVNIRKDVLVLAAMTLWACLGNFLYSSSLSPYRAVYNWFFVTADPFGILPAEIGAFVMPLLNFAVFFAVIALVYCVIALNRRARA